MAKIVIKNLHVSVKDKEILKGLNFVFDEHESVALLGPNGNGKSTLIQHINGLIEATSGKIIIDGVDITKKDVNLLDIRKQVGLVFQYSEYQLFEETIEKDIAFGPKNLKLTEEEVNKRVKKSMEMVGLDYKKY